MTTVLRLLPLCAAALAAGAASGQDTTPDLRMEITGSRIKRVEGETALPVQIITRDEMQQAGWATAAELMAHVSANLNGFNDQLSIGNSAPGYASANLRGLGGASTLVLLDGRRIANYAFNGAVVDLNSIPLAALERVEILKDGASSIYGTDAVAGVVNFILRKAYRGAEITIQGASTEHGGGNRQQATATVGAGDLASDRYNAFVTVDWQKDDALAARARAFSRTAYLPDEGVDKLSTGTFPANIFAPRGGLLSPALAAGCAPPVSLPHVLASNGQTACGYDYASIIDDIAPTERVNVVGRASYRIAPGHELFAEYVYTYNDLLLRIAASPTARITTQNGSPIFYPADGPYYPSAFAAANGLSGDLPIAYRTVTLGPRSDEARTAAQRIVVGADGEWNGWSYNAAFNHSDNTATDTFKSGFVSIARLVDAMGTGLINPFGPSTPAGDALLQSTQITGQVRTAKGSMDQIDAHASNEILELAGGPLAIAFGAEARRERLVDHPGDILSSGDVLAAGSPTEPQDASRRAEALFAELNVPIVKSFEAQLSARYDHYSDFGGTTNPKIALRWQPIKSLLLRGSWGTGFRAPALPDLFTPQDGAVVDEGFADPVRCPVTKSDADCFLQYTLFFGGNPLLQPERSRQYSAGIVWEPSNGASIALDYWKIDKTRVIGSLSSDIVFANYATYAPTNIVRGPVEPTYPNLPGPITGVILWNQNVGNVRTSGVDVDAVARLDLGDAGRFTFRLNGTWVADWQQFLDGLAPQSVAGAYGLDGPIPRWKHYATATWEYGPWATAMAQTFQTSYVDQNPDVSANPRRVGASEVWDMQEAYSGFKNFVVAAGVRNLFDRAPPFTNQRDTSQIGYDPRYADPRGRAYYLRIAYAFK